MTDITTPTIGIPPKFTPLTLAQAFEHNQRRIEQTGGTISGLVDLRSVQLDHPVFLRNMVFEQVVDLRDARLRRTVELVGCDFRRGLLMDGARVEGTLDLTGSRFGALEDGNGVWAARLPLLRVGGNLLGHGIWAQGGIDLSRAEVRGRLDLSSAPTATTVIRGELRLIRCEVDGAVRLNGVRIEKSMDAEGARVGGSFSLGPLHADHERELGRILQVSKVGERVVFMNAELKGELNLTGIIVGNNVDLQRAKVHGGLFCRCIGGKRPMIGGILAARGAEISGVVDLSGASIRRGVYIEGSQVTGPLLLRRCDSEGDQFDPDPRPGPRLRNWRTCVGGDVRLAFAQVRGTVEAVGLLTRGELDLDGAAVSGFVVLLAVTVKGDLRLNSLQANGLSIGYTDRVTAVIHGNLFASSCRIGSALKCNGVTVHGEADFTGTRIEGDVEFREGDAREWEAEAPPSTFLRSLSLQDCVITGRMVAEVVHIVGALRMARADIRGDANLSSARIHQPRQPGDAMDDSPPQGALDATGVRVRGRLQCNGARVGGTLNLQNSRIGGGLFCGTVPSDESMTETEGMTVTASVLLDGAEVMKQADFRGAQVDGELSMERMLLEGRLRCPIAVPSAQAGPRTDLASVDLRNLRVRHLDLRPDDRRADGSVASTRVQLQLEGCQFVELSVPSDDYTAVFRCEDMRFSQSSYMSVERWLRDRGDDHAAETVYRLMLAHRRREMKSPLEKIADRSVELLRAAALKFQVLFIVAVSTYLFSVYLFSQPGALAPGKDAPEVKTAQTAATVVGNTAPATPQPRRSNGAPPIKPPGTFARADPSSPAAAVPTTRAPRFVDAALTATKVHLPMLGFPGDDRWIPADSAVRVAGWKWLWMRYDVYGVIVSMLSYAVVPLIIGGIATTWLRRGSRSG